MTTQGKVSRFVNALRNGTPTHFTGETYGRPVEYSIYEGGNNPGDPRNMSAARLWKTQPHLRTVVDFQARSISMLGLHLFDRKNEDETYRVRDGKVSAILSRPNPRQTLSEFIGELVGDWSLYDEAYIMLLPNEFGNYTLWNVPRDWVNVEWKNSFEISGYKVSGHDGKEIPLKPEQMLFFKGWTPGDTQSSTSPVETLRLILAEQYSAMVYRDQNWRSKGRLGGIIKRPAEAPAWNNTARARFMKMWEAFTGNHGERAGQDVLLEDGMSYENSVLVAREQQYVEATKLSLETVAQVYHINPTMIGMLENANYSNVREFRRGLYGDTLGPIIKMIEDRFNGFLLPMLGAGPSMYVEFNVEAMLKGSFEEQAKVVSKATGAPWQTVNEARKLFNLPPVEGGNVLVVPLNLGTPQDLGENGEPKMAPDELVKRGQYASTMIKAGFDRAASLAAAGLPDIEQSEAPAVVEEEEVLEEDETKSVDDVFNKFLDRQTEVVKSKQLGGSADWWDGERWDRELSADLKSAGMGEEFADFMATTVNASAFQFFHAGEFDNIGELKQITSNALSALSV